MDLRDHSQGGGTSLGKTVLLARHFSNDVEGVEVVTPGNELALYVRLDVLMLRNRN